MMKIKSLQYFLGLLMIISGTILFYLLGYSWLWLIIPITGMVLVALSDKSIWLKAFTIVLVPVLSIVVFFLVLILTSNEAI
ncbi:hypothetical protein SAMN05421768_10650 [Chryseobacterium joostei]|uniref:Uncharacterized protein n=2 Tax=Chryseobacterium joostei TaxID=112234 RepID=A0A1N7ILT5_9FLAO|nr:hypothetical protein [Chryseobacterium joostei]SIS38035.1 hypothetical protein SAMN05421768_10650 [Chryseobacterium joostei]